MKRNTTEGKNLISRLQTQIANHQSQERQLKSEVEDLKRSIQRKDTSIGQLENQVNVYKKKADQVSELTAQVKLKISELLTQVAVRHPG